MKKITDITHIGPLFDASSGYADFEKNLLDALFFCKNKKPMTKIRITVSNVLYHHDNPIRVAQERIVCVRFLKRKYKQLYEKEASTKEYGNILANFKATEQSATKEKAWGPWIIYSHLKKPEQYPEGKILII